MGEGKMIKGLIFDLDGVLVETKEIHYRALNKALKLNGLEEISLEQHLEKFNGLPTLAKINLLKEEGLVLERQLEEKVLKDKKQFTKEELSNLTEDEELAKILYDFCGANYTIGVASNAIRKTVLECLGRLQINYYVDHILSNEDVINPKPNSEIYIKMAKELNLEPCKCLVFEDNKYGIQSAIDAGCAVIKINSTEHLKEILRKYLG